jgi:hypothetical protein
MRRRAFSGKYYFNKSQLKALRPRRTVLFKDNSPITKPLFYPLVGIISFFYLRIIYVSKHNIPLKTIEDEGRVI